MMLWCHDAAMRETTTAPGGFFTKGPFGIVRIF